MKPDSLGTSAAGTSPTRVAMMVDKRSIIMKKKKWYVTLRKRVGMGVGMGTKGKCELVKPRTSQVSQEDRCQDSKKERPFYTVQPRQVGRR